MEGKIRTMPYDTNMQPSVAHAKSTQSDIIQMHPPPSWKQYESEEEDVSETSSQSVFSPTEGDICSHDEDDSDESVCKVEYADTEIETLSPARLVSSDDSSSLYSRRLSIVTAKRSSAATYVAHCQGHDPAVSEDEETPSTEYATPQTSPFYLSPVCYVPETSGGVSGEEDELEYDSHDEEETNDSELDEVLEAKQVVFTTPASKPNIVMIQSPTTEAILSARMGDPFSRSDGQNSSAERPIKICKRLSTKRSSSPSGMSPPDRSKRFSAVFYRELAQDKEVVSFWDSRNHVRAQSSQGYGRSRSRSRGDSLLRESVSSSDTESIELRQVRPRRNPSQRSSRSNRITQDGEMTRNYSRPRAIRSSSVASANTTASSTSWKRVQSHNRSNTSLQYSSASSLETSRSSSSSSSSPSSAATVQSEADVPKPAPHPLSIITTPTSPTTSSNEDHHTRSALQPQSAITVQSYIDWSPVEQSSSTSAKLKAFPYSRTRNPSLPLSLATGPEELDPAMTHSRTRKNSCNTLSPISTKKLSTSASGSTSASASSKAQTHASNTMKLLMGGFRGLSKQRGRQ